MFIRRAQFDALTCVYVDCRRFSVSTAVGNFHYAARCDRIQVIAIVLRIGREITEIDIFHFASFFAREFEIVRRQPMTKTAAASVHLHEQLV